MKSSNLLIINDWPIFKAIRTILVILAAIYSLMYFDIMGINVPFLRQIVVSIFLLFFPGILVLRILKVRDHDKIEVLLYSLGLSISILMFSGFFANLIYPIIGIHKPISFFPLMNLLSLIVLILCFISYLIDKDYKKMISERDNISIEPQLLSIFLLPIITILATYCFEQYQNNCFTLILLFIFACIPLIVCMGKFLHENYYPICIFSVSISLLFHITLISNYLTGYDINVEYYFSNLTAYSGIWDFSYPNNVNSMLSITILAPILSIMTSIDVVWVLKIMFPLIFSFVPVGIFLIIKKQVNTKISFLASFFFMFTFMYYSIMTQLARQQIGELFIILFVLALLDDKLSRINRAVLCSIFCFSLAVSHYALNYIFLFSILVASIIMIFLDPFSVKLKKYAKQVDFSFKLSQSSYDVFNLRYIILLIIFALSWYIYISSSSSFISVTNIINNIITNVLDDLLNPMSRELATVLVGQISPTGEVTKYLYIIFNISVALGILYTFYDKSSMSFKKEYIAFSLAYLFFWSLSIIIPNFAMWFTSRLYQITLIFLTPFGIIGLTIISGTLIRLLRFNEYLNDKFIYICVSFFLFVFLLFNSQVASSIINDDTKSIALNYTVDSAKFNDPEVTSARWISNVSGNSVILGDVFACLLLLGFALDKVQFYDEYPIKNGSFLYLRNHNILHENMLNKENRYFPLKNILFDDLIYNNKFSRIVIIEE